MIMPVMDCILGTVQANGMSMAPGYNPGTQSLWDPLGLFHNTACTFSFMDGHAERKKWLDKRTIIYCNSREEAEALGFGKGQVFSPPNEDLDWLDEHYPGKTNIK